MSLNVISQPAAIDNSAQFEIDTTLVEDTSHVNLRLRAEIYHEGIIKAVIEKPKGLTVFSLNDILKSLTPGLKFARDSGQIIQAGTVGANLIESWSGIYSTFTSTVNIINSAIASIPSYAYAYGAGSDFIHLIAGHIYCFYVLNYVNNLGVGYGPQIQFVDSILNPLCPELIQMPYAQMQNNKSVIFMCVQSGDISVKISNASNANWSGEIYLKDITTDRNTIGSPLAVYMPVFTEVWEDATGVTTLGSNSVTDAVVYNLYRFVPAKGDSLNWSNNYVLQLGFAQLFANKTIRNGIIKFFTYNPAELWVCFFTESLSIDLHTSKDNAAYTSNTYYCPEGWGVVILNIGELMSSVTTSLRFYLNDTQSGVTISEVFTVLINSSAIDERVILEFDGDLGGKEYLSFEGMKDIQYTSIRNYRTGSKKGKKPLLFTGINKQSIATRMGPGVNDMVNTDYLKTLLVSDNVKKLETDYSDTDVTIVSDTVKIGSSDMFTNQIDIEWED
jgi:hypothetical protein